MNQFEVLVGQTVPFNSGCIDADSAMKMDKALEAGDKQTVSEIVLSGACSKFPGRLLGEVQSFIEKTGDVFTMHVMVKDQYEFFVHVNQQYMDAVIKALGLGGA